MSIKVIFLDRDGVINKEIGYLHKIQDFEFIDGIFNACLHFQSLGFKLIIITNQSGITRGYYTQQDFDNLTNWMLQQFSQQGINILEVFFCPHGTNSTCQCRKPRSGMLIKACNKYTIDISLSWLIGDKEADITAANNANINNTVLVKSGHPINLQSSACFVCNTIADTLDIIK